MERLTDANGKEKRVLLVGGPANGIVLTTEIDCDGIVFSSADPAFIHLSDVWEHTPVICTRYKFETIRVEGHDYHVGRLSNETETQCFERILDGFIKSAS